MGESAAEKIARLARTEGFNEAREFLRHWVPHCDTCPKRIPDPAGYKGSAKGWKCKVLGHSLNTSDISTFFCGHHPDIQP